MAGKIELTLGSWEPIILHLPDPNDRKVRMAQTDLGAFYVRAYYHEDDRLTIDVAGFRLQICADLKLKRQKSGKLVGKENFVHRFHSFPFEKEVKSVVPIRVVVTEE